jgi:hypothetical protein
MPPRRFEMAQMAYPISHYALQTFEKAHPFQEPVNLLKLCNDGKSGRTLSVEIQTA